MIDRMEAQLLLHEGLRLQPYRDTEDNWMVGVGYNVTARGWDLWEQVNARGIEELHITDVRVTREESLAVLRTDLARIRRAVPVYFPEFTALDEVRQRVIIDLAFNPGFKALSFERTIAAIKARDWSRAARELWRSKWSTQIGDGPGRREDRADRLTKMLLTGTDYVDPPGVVVT